MIPEITGLELLNDAQKEYVLTVSKGMKNFGWNKVSIGWYSDGSRSMIVEDINGTIYPGQDIPQNPVYYK